MGWEPRDPNVRARSVAPRGGIGVESAYRSVLCFLTVAPYAIRTRDKESLLFSFARGLCAIKGSKLNKKRNPNLLFQTANSWPLREGRLGVRSKINTLHSPSLVLSFPKTCGTMWCVPCLLRLMYPPMQWYSSSVCGRVCFSSFCLDHMVESAAA